jgi:hypothetical protein
MRRITLSPAMLGTMSSPPVFCAAVVARLTVNRRRVLVRERINARSSDENVIANITFQCVVRASACQILKVDQRIATTWGDAI